MNMYPCCPEEDQSLENNPLKDGVSERRPVMSPWEKRTTQAPSEVYVEPYDKEKSND